jgi:phospholipid-translocating ATPase
MAYNSIFTLLPVAFFLLDKDVGDVTACLHPYLYADSRCRTFCNVRTMFWWMVRAVWQGFVILVVVHFSCGVDTFSAIDGSPVGLNEAQQVAYSILILNVSLTTTWETKHFTSLNLIFIWGNWVLYLAATVVANVIPPLAITRDIFWVAWRCYSSPLDWIIVVCGVSLAVGPVIFIQSVFTVCLPTRAQKLRKIAVMCQAGFRPTYVVGVEDLADGYSADSVYTEAENPPTVWDRSHGICTPLFALCHH